MRIKISLRGLRRLALVLILVLASGFLGYRFGFSRTPSSTMEGKDFSLFWLVWHRLEEKYLDREEISEQKMIEGAISGMVDSLGDPYTAFFASEDNKMNKEDLFGEFGGVGIQLGYKNKTLAVISPLNGTPAEKAGIKAGDLILNIKDESANVDQSTEDLSLPEAVKLIRGEKGSKIVLTIAREGETGPRDFEVIRDTIVVDSLESDWEIRENKNFAYVHLLQFSEKAGEEWVSWVNETLSKSNPSGLDGIILDLRNNPGGYLEGAVFVAGEFLPMGRPIVWQEDYQGKKTKFSVDRTGRFLKTPLVVLVNQGSASASEILAGALKDYQRATLIGTTTFGKGIVQEPQELPGGAGLHITTAKWLLPNGDSIHEKGVAPNIEIDQQDQTEEDPFLGKAIEILLAQ
ncbi:MAG: S41 family peptidase [Patescibacteria group bacterium]|nr:S41 family peptidase [Patescibacteria group bacterium]